MTSGDPTAIFRQPSIAMGRRSRPNPNRAQVRSRRPRKRDQYYQVDSPSYFRVEKFAEVDNLHVAYRILERDGGPGGGVDFLRFDDFSPSEVFDALRRVSAAILERTYCPYPTRLIQIPKGNGRFRELRLQRITDRTVAKALQLALDSFWRSRLPGIGRSVFHIFATMQRTMRQRKTYVLAIDDIRDCFPSARIDDIMACHQEHITQPDLLWLIETLLRGHEGPEHQIGLDQGSPYSPVALELMLQTRLDTPMETTCQGSPLPLRYVDNLTYVCGSEREGYETLQKTEEILSSLDLALKGADGDPKDIRDPNPEKIVLGFKIHWKDGQIKFKIPEKAFQNLEKGLIKATNHTDPLTTCKMMTKGWMEAMGPTLTKSVTPEVIDRVLFIARRCGFRGINPKELYGTAKRARQQWIRFSESEPTH